MILEEEEVVDDIEAVAEVEEDLDKNEGW